MIDRDTFKKMKQALKAAGFVLPLNWSGDVQEGLQNVHPDDEAEYFKIVNTFVEGKGGTDEQE